MPSLEHNALVEMFRENPALLPRLLTTLLHLDIPHHVTVAVVESSLDQLIPVEFRADLVHELRDEQGLPVLSVVVEVQRHKDPTKKYALPLYVAAVHAKTRCATVVLIVAMDPDVAAWAAEEIDLGLGRCSLKPLVLGPRAVPRITDPTVAAQTVELSVLSAVAHGNGPNGFDVVRTALLALDDLDREHAMVYFQIIYNVLREPMKRALEALVMERQRFDWKQNLPPFLKEPLDRSCREAEIMGELKGLRDALLRQIKRIGFTLTEEERTRIQTCSDVATLERWVENVIGAKGTSDILS